VRLGSFIHSAVRTAVGEEVTTQAKAVARLINYNFFVRKLMELKKGMNGARLSGRASKRCEGPTRSGKADSLTCLKLQPKMTTL
jgi:hypothetical protein